MFNVYTHDEELLMQQQQQQASPGSCPRVGNLKSLAAHVSNTTTTTTTTTTTSTSNTGLTTSPTTSSFMGLSFSEDEGEEEEVSGGVPTTSTAATTTLAGDTVMTDSDEDSADDEDDSADDYSSSGDAAADSYLLQQQQQRNSLVSPFLHPVGYPTTTTTTTNFTSKRSTSSNSHGSTSHGSKPTADTEMSDGSDTTMYDALGSLPGSSSGSSGASSGAGSSSSSSLFSTSPSSFLSNLNTPLQSSAGTTSSFGGLPLLGSNSHLTPGGSSSFGSLGTAVGSSTGSATPGSRAGTPGLNTHAFGAIGSKTPAQTAAAFEPSLKFEAAGWIVPHPSKEDTGGEDAFFISGNSSCIGVADGVGGWGADGNSALFSRLLMSNAMKASEANSAASPVELMDASYSAISPELIGSSTACIAKLSGSTLSTANLGDSGCLVIRMADGPAPGQRVAKLIFKTAIGQHWFNCPAQLGTGSDDTPADSLVDSVTLEAGDFVVACTDGVLDNLYDEEIMMEVGRLEAAAPEVIAQRLSHRARELAASTTRLSPFARGARAEGIDFSGGKLDDITVVVARAVITSTN